MRPHVALACLLIGCGGRSPGAASPHGTSAETAERALPKQAALDAEVAALPGARAEYVPDPVFGGSIYVLQVGPTAQRADETAHVEAPPLVLVHGLGDAGLRDFYPILPGLAERRRVIAFDLPGFARSTAVSGPYDPTRYAEVVARVVRDYAGGRADVLGHSMGGAIALEYSAHHPEQLRRLVLVDAAGILYKETIIQHQIDTSVESAARVPTLPPLPGVPVDVASKMQHVADNVSKSVEGAGAALLSVTRPIRPAPATVAAIAPDRATTQAALALSEHDFGPALKGSSAPALVVWGGDDPIVPVRTGQLLSCRLPASRLVVLDGVGHVPMAQAEQRVLSAVVDYLDVSAPSGETTCPPALPSAVGAEAPDAACESQADFELNGGVYDEVRLSGCRRARLHDVVARKLVLDNSTVTGTSLRVEEGVTAVESRLVLTGAFLGGAVALDASTSAFDFAGVELSGAQPVHIERRSTFLMSHCTVGGAEGQVPVHGVFSLQAGKTF